jgi:death-on-curing protein
MTASFWYPSVEDVLEIHDEIVSEYSETSSGIQSRGDIEFALNYVEEGTFGERPGTIHEKAFHLLRLLVANHPFVDGNKRTALNTVSVFYFLNEYRFEYDNEIRETLKQFGTDETTVDEDQVLEYLRTNTRKINLDKEISKWRDDLVQHGLDHMTDESTDQNR